MKKKHDFKKNGKGRATVRGRRLPHAVHPPRPREGGAVRAPEECGRFMGTRRGFGFVAREEGGADVFIPAHRTMGALDGDTVRIAVYRDDERPEGAVLAVLNRSNHSVIGTVVRDAEIDLRPMGRLFLLPDSPRMPPFLLSQHARMRPGDKIEARLTAREGEAIFVRSFGSAKTRAANYAAILSDCAVPTAFSDAAVAEADRVALAPLATEGRRRVRESVLTIDGAGAKDLDDAVSIRRAGTGYVLSVHIADVSHYVRPFSLLDATAHERGTSLYFADRVVPMLPEALSNGACSLNAGEEKLALTAEMTLDGEGNILRTRVYRSVIESKLRGVYSEVNDLFLHGKESVWYKKYRPLYEPLMKMRALYEILAARDRRRGVPELETAEAVITLSKEGDPTDVTRAERGEAERLIEAFMLTANRAVAELLHERGIPCVYRIHEPPPAEKYGELCTYLSALSLPLPWRGGEKPSAAAISRLLVTAGERGLLTPVSYHVLRAMAKARYEATPSSHFGLSLSLYCHFTSPIRRLSDLVTHRILKAVLLDGAAPGKYRAAARRAADAATAGEVRALTAERRIEALYKTVYMQKHIGERYEGLVSSVTPHGYYVELDNTCEGLVPLSLLPAEYTYEEATHTLRAQGAVIAVGDRVGIIVREADVAQGKILFEPIE